MLPGPGYPAADASRDFLAFAESRQLDLKKKRSAFTLFAFLAYTYIEGFSSLRRAQGAPSEGLPTSKEVLRNDYCDLPEARASIREFLEKI